MPDVDLEKILSHAGDYGKYQFYLMFLLSVTKVLWQYNYFAQMFIALTPVHYCAVLEGDTKWKSEKCNLYYYNDTEKIQRECTAWNYELDHEFETIVKELNWVCGEDWKPALGQSIYFVGTIVGTYVFGVIADSKGRLHALVWSNVIAGIGNVATIFATNLPMYSVFRFIAGCAVDTNFMMMYIIVIEYIRPSKRTIGLNICMGVASLLGALTLPFIALASQNWKYYLIAISVPDFLMLSYYFFAPESAQWLVTKGRFNEAINRYKRIAEVNKKSLSEEVLKDFECYVTTNINESKKKSRSFFGLFRYPNSRKKICLLIFKTMAITFSVDEISRNIGNVGYSPFIVFAVLSVAFIPSSLSIITLHDRIGRKGLAVASLFICGLFVAALAIVLSLIELSNPALLLALKLGSYIFIMITFHSNKQYTAEFLPTEVRGQGVSVTNLLGYAAALLSPQIIYLSAVWKPLPDVITGTVLILAAIASLFLPETLNKALPTVIEDSENFGKDEGVFEFTFNKKAKA